VTAGPLVIEPASTRDLDAITTLESVSFPSPWKREFFASEVGAPGRYNRVARRGGSTVVAYLFAMFLFDEMHINKIAVDPKLRRGGVANALMADCFAFADERGIHSISLEVRESNDGAQEFYRRLSFEPVHRRRNYYPDGEAAVVMTKVL
jgi:ribosomal-protein-alanine N-acetyltransferase